MTLRSILTAAALDPGALERAANAGSDAVILDLRASAAGGEAGLAAAAAMLRRLPDGSLGARIWIRPHPLDDARLPTELGVLCPLGPEAVVLPRAETAADVEHLAALLAVQEARAGLPDGSLKIIAMIETAGALFELNRVARASDRMAALCWDGEALARDLGADEHREGGRWTDPLQTARTLLLAACADARLPAIDSPFTDVDAASFREEAERAVRDGFVGKFATTTDQIPILNMVFAARS